jgi:hypothetical protein
MVAPSHLRFRIPALPRDSHLTFIAGLPYAARSDGLDFAVILERDIKQQTLLSVRISPERGRSWVQERIPLGVFENSPGTLIFEASVGASGDATADWLAIAQARIDGERVFDLRRELPRAQIDAPTGMNYHTESNRPIFPMSVWLAQRPALRLLASRPYRPSIPLQLMDATSRAGFWSMGWGYLPFTPVFDETPATETISLYEVSRKVDPYGASQPPWYPE